MKYKVCSNPYEDSALGQPACGQSGLSKRWQVPHTGLLLVLGLGLLCALPAFGAGAPLDTLREASLVTETEAPDPRYPTSDIEITRKRLPDVQAAAVPQFKAPKRPPRLDDPLGAEYHFEQARAAMAAGQTDTANDHLKEALAGAPHNPRYLWWKLSRAVRSGDLATLRHVIPRYWRAVAEAPLERLRLVAMAHQSALLLTALFWTMLVVGLTIAWWRHLAHDLTAMLFKDRRHSPRLILPLLLPVAILLLKPGWLGFLAAMSVPLLIQVRGRSRVLLTTVWLTAIVLVFPNWPMLNLAAPALDPSSEATLLERACTLAPSGPLTTELRERLKTVQDTPRKHRLTVALAIQEARRGNYTRSSKLFQQVLNQNPVNYPAMVGIANNAYYLGRHDRASELFQDAARAHPHSGEIQYNLAQVYFKKLFVPEAAEALQQARNRGFDPSAHQSSGTPNDAYSSVIYPGLTTAQMIQACRFESHNYPALLTLSAWEGMLGSPPIPLLLILVVPLLLSAALISFWSNQHDPRICENCGIPVCQSCCRVRDGAWLCPTCGETADRARSDLILATLLKNLSRREHLAFGHGVVLSGRLFPGAGHLMIERVGGAVGRLLTVSLGLFLITTGWTFDPASAWITPGLLLPNETLLQGYIPMPAYLWSGWLTPLPIAGLALLSLAWLTALADGSALRRRIPERFSLTPATSGEAGDTATAFANDIQTEDRATIGAP